MPEKAIRFRFVEFWKSTTAPVACMWWKLIHESPPAPPADGQAPITGAGKVEGDAAPGYYFFVFEDPDGIRLEVNFIPGKGLLVSRDDPLIPSTDLDWDQNP